MSFRPILTGALALMLLCGGAASAEERGLLPKLGLPNLFGDKQRPDVQYVQSGDPRIMALEEEVRALSGRVEELNFQILQMQDQMRKMQEDNEFRFQELEKRSEAGGAPRATRSEKAGAAAAPAPEKKQAAMAPSPPAEVPAGQSAGGAATAPGPKTFGTVTFDAGGNVTGGSVAEAPAAAGAEGAAPGATSDQTTVAALPATDDPEEAYRNSYEFILSGDYGTAEAGFRDHIARFPGDPKTADARYWLGESLLGQKKYRDAAEVFLDANKQFPSARKAPDMLLKLGVSLTALDQRDVACATFQEVGRRYPDISAALKERVRQEQALAKC